MEELLHMLMSQSALQASQLMCIGASSSEPHCMTKPVTTRRLGVHGNTALDLAC